jgi:hypothetical protein
MGTAASGSSRRSAVAVVTGLVMVFLFVWLFAAALHQPKPHDLPIGLVAPAAVATKIEAAMGKAAPGTFAVSSYAGKEEAVKAIEDRDVVGALVVGGPQPEILIAGGASEPTARAVEGALQALAKNMGQTPTVEDVRPLPESDPRGLVPFFLVLGVSVSAFIFQLSLGGGGRRRSTAWHCGLMTGFAVLDGLIASLAVSVALGFDSTYWGLAGVCMLLALAVAAATRACIELFGRAGTGVAGLIVILLGNASSGSIIGARFLPEPFRTLSPGLPAGAALEAVRSTLYFSGRGLGWSLAGLAFWVVGSWVILGCVEVVRRARARKVLAAA